MASLDGFKKNLQANGACLCGAVTIRIDGPVKDVSCCHCSQCRKQTGLYYATIEMPKTSLTIITDNTLSQYRASDVATRYFCSTCGSAMFWLSDGSDYIDVLAGAIDGPTGLVTRKHINCADKGDFYMLPTDGVKFSQQGGD